MRFALLVLLVACHRESATATTMGGGRWMIQFESNTASDAGHVLELANAKASEVCGGGGYKVEQSTGGVSSNDFTNISTGQVIHRNRTSTAFVVKCE